MPAIIIQICEVCLIPLLGVLTTFLIKWFNAKSKELIAKTDNEYAAKYLSMVTETVTDCVIATNQTYVEALKAEGNFDAEAQKIALEKTLSAVLDILSDDAKEYLEEAYGDFNVFIINKIEAVVNDNKPTAAVG